MDSTKALVFLLHSVVSACTGGAVEHTPPQTAHTVDRGLMESANWKNLQFPPGVAENGGRADKLESDLMVNTSVDDVNAGQP